MTALLARFIRSEPSGGLIGGEGRSAAYRRTLLEEPDER
jgi:hypothetical protein